MVIQEANSAKERTGGGFRMQRVSKRYRGPEAVQDSYAVKDISLNVRSGDSLGIVGPNGAGKSTILRLVSGVTVPTSGRIERWGHTVALIELSTGVHHELTGRENMKILRNLFGARRSSASSGLDEITRFAELGSSLDAPVRSYSSGMVARLAMAVAVHSQPDLLLIDEVLSVGDLRFQERCQDRLGELRAAGAAVVIVSHDLDLIDRVCDRAALLERGGLTCTGETADVLRRYLGRPSVETEPGGIGTTLEAARVDVGVALELLLPDRMPPATDHLEIQYVALLSDGMYGHEHAVVFGEFEAQEMGRSVWLSTRGVPPGHYELHITAKDASSARLAADAHTFTLMGSSGPNAIRLEGSVTFDQRPPERF